VDWDRGDDAKPGQRADATANVEVGGPRMR
jgi:hypothetical protein